MVFNGEYAYVELIHSASNRRGSWDPEITVSVGDWGKIVKPKRFWIFHGGNRMFVKEGNILEDGTAKQYEISTPTEYAAGTEDGVHLITSQNVTELLSEW